MKLLYALLLLYLGFYVVIDTESAWRDSIAFQSPMVFIPS